MVERRKVGNVISIEKFLNEKKRVEEKAASRSFFEVEIADPPERVAENVNRVEERLNALGYGRFARLNFPDVDLNRGDPFWKRDGILKPSIEFFNHLGIGFYPEKFTQLKRGLYLIDERLRPRDDGGDQRYDDDGFMEDLMHGLRIKGDRNGKRIGNINGVPNYSRFGATPREIENIILPTFAHKIGEDFLEGGSVRGARFIEFVTARNINPPDRVEGDSLEWFGADEGGREYRYHDSKDENGDVILLPNTGGIDMRAKNIAFRPIIEFPY